jgi:uncharacterized protein YhaN
MRFQRLHIPAFGPFTNLELTFPSTKNDFHVIYGGNEAGKSSLLRAIRDLLFGIHSQSPDNFLHDYKHLRVLGEIENLAGDRLVIQRRKGSKNTLLDAEERPFHDSSLRPFLGGIDQKYFSAMFGLGASELREGAAELLAGEGELGKALFSASLGGTPIQRVLNAIVAESEQLFKGKSAKDVSIRPAAGRHKELLKKSREAIVSSETWDMLERSLAEHTASKKRLEEEIGNIVRDLAWIQRCEDALPSVGRLSDEMSKFSALPALPEVASDFVERASAARNAVNESTRIVRTEAEHLLQLQKNLDNCKTSSALIAVADDLDLLHEDLGAYRERKKALTKLTIELADLEHTLRAGMKALEVEGGFESLESLRLSSAVQMSCREAANNLHGAMNKQTELNDKVVVLKAGIEDDENELVLMPKMDLAPLRKALEDAAEATEANKTLAGSQSSVAKLIRVIGTEQALVPGVPQDLDAVSLLAVPSPATIRKFRERFDNLERDIEVTNRLIREEKVTVNALKNELHRIERRGELPSEDSLYQARRHRDHGWQLVLAEWKGGGAMEELDPALPLVEAFPHAIISADKIADQLRTDAETVAQAEEKRLQIHISNQKVADANESLDSLRIELEKCQASWEAEWTQIGVPARSPVEMEEWRENWVRLRRTISEFNDAEETVRSKSAQVQQAREKLSAVLPDSSEQSFSMLYAAAIKLVQQGENSSGRRDAIEERLKKAKKILADLDRQASELCSAVQSAEENWKRWCRSAGLAEDTTPESGLILLQERKELLAKFDSWNKLSGEATGILSEIKRYERMVYEHAMSLGIEADLTESQEAGLWAALSDVRKVQAKCEQLMSQVTDAEANLATLRQAEVYARQYLEELMQLCGLDDPSELEPLLANLENRTKIQDRINGHRIMLSGLARGQSLDEFIALVQAENAADLPRRKTLLETTKAAKSADLHEVQAALDGLNRQKKEHEKAGDAAADFRQQAESVAATLKQDATQFIRLRLAAHFLRNQIERFREENQGPLLEKSGQRFKQMTRNAFEGLAAEFNDDDIPVIVGRKGNGINVPVNGMSDGSRDQLYLALRIAAMERYLEDHEPMPLILDDLLITFDNERTTAILPQLANLAERTQIFLFTHHKHIVDLCYETLGNGQFALHQLRNVVAPPDSHAMGP